MVAFSWVSPTVFHWILLYTEVFPYCESMGLRRNKPLCQTFQKTTSTPSQYRLLLISMLCLLSKRFAKIQNSLSSLREKVQAGAPVFRLADGCLPGMSYPVTVRCSHWSFQTDDLGGETECWFCTLLRFSYSTCIKEKATAVVLIIFFFCTGYERKQKLLYIVHSINRCSLPETISSQMTEMEEYQI